MLFPISGNRKEIGILIPDSYFLFPISTTSQEIGILFPISYFLAISRNEKHVSLFSFLEITRNRNPISYFLFLAISRDVSIFAFLEIARNRNPISYFLFLAISRNEKNAVLFPVIPISYFYPISRNRICSNLCPFKRAQSVRVSAELRQ